MSIMKPVYKQTGGVIAPGLPNIDVSQGLDKIYQDALAYSADPQNIPQYYTGTTVADFDPLQKLAQEGKIGAAEQYDQLTSQLLGDYQQQLDPGSALNQYLGGQAAQQATGSYFGAGTPGSQRNQYAANLASQDAVRASRDKALSNISGLRSSLTGGSNIVGQVGDERQDLSQDIIDADRDRFNYAQESPGLHLERLLGLAAQQQALQQGNVGYEAPGGFGGIFGSLLNSFGGGGGGGGALGGLGSLLGFQDGGMVPQDGAPMDPMATPADPMMGGDPMMAPPPGPEMMPPVAEVDQITAIAGPDVSEIDKAEGILQGLAAASGGSLKVTRKTKGGKKK